MSLKLILASVALATVLQLTAASNSTHSRGLTTEVASAPCSSCTTALAAKGGSTIIRKPDGAQVLIDDRLLLGFDFSNKHHFGFVTSVAIPVSASTATTAYLKLPQAGHKGIHLALDEYALNAPRLQVNVGSFSNVGPQSPDELVKYAWRDGRDPWAWYLKLDPMAVVANAGQTVELEVTLWGLAEACPTVGTATITCHAAALEFCQSLAGSYVRNPDRECRHDAGVNVCYLGGPTCGSIGGSVGWSISGTHGPAMDAFMQSRGFDCPATMVAPAFRGCDASGEGCALNRRRMATNSHCRFEGGSTKQMEFYSQTSDRPAIVFE